MNSEFSVLDRNRAQRKRIVPSRVEKARGAPPEESEVVRDRVLVNRMKHGDQSAFDEMVKRYRTRIYAVTHQFLGNHQDAEEVTQDAFINALRGVTRFRGDAAFSTWLHQIAMNLARNRYWYWRRRKRHATISMDAPADGDSGTTFGEVIASEGDSPYHTVDTSDLIEQIGNGMERLSNKHREILVMRNVDNVPYADIARVLKISLGTVKSRIARARESLRALLVVASVNSAPAG